MRLTRHGATWTALLSRADFNPGTNRLLVQSRSGGKLGGTASSSLVLARPAAPLPVSGTFPAVTIRTPDATFARLTVNGKDLRDDQRTATASNDHHWDVSVRDGLKPGRNVLAVQAWDAGGHSMSGWARRGSCSAWRSPGWRETTPIGTGC